MCLDRVSARKWAAYKARWPKHARRFQGDPGPLRVGKAEGRQLAGDTATFYSTSQLADGTAPPTT